MTPRNIGRTVDGDRGELARAWRASCSAAASVLACLMILQAALAQVAGATVRELQPDQPGDAVEKAPGGPPQPAPHHRLSSQKLGALGVRTISLLMAGQRGGAVRGGFLWTVIPGRRDHGRYPVRVVIDVDGPSLTNGDTGETVNLGVYVYALNQTGEVIARLAQGARVPAAWLRSDPRATALKFIGQLELEPGAYSLRALVRNHATDQVFLTRCAVELPAPDRVAPLLMPLLFPEAVAPSVLMCASDLGDGCELAVGKEVVYPSTWPVLTPGKPTGVIVAGAGWQRRPTVVASVIDVQGRVVAEPGLLVEEEAIADAGGISYHQASLTGLDLAEGVYELELSLEGARLRLQPLVVASPEPEPSESAGRRVATAGQAGPPQLRSVDGSFAGAVAVAAYLEALRLLADGDRRGAVAAAVELERQAFNTFGGDGLTRLRATERTIVRGLARRDSAGVVPVLLLHHEVTRRHLAAKHGALLDHSRRVLTEIAEMLHRRDPSPATVGFVEGVLLSLASDLYQAAVYQSAKELLERAVRLDPSHEPSLLALGCLLESTGRPGLALDLFRRIVRLDPGHAEARLRLAVNLARDGAREAAEPLLRDLAVSGSTSWRVAVAHQELARLLRSSGRFREAEALLWEGISRFPDDQTLRVQLAFVLENRGEPGAAGDLLEDLQAVGPDRATSARVYYSNWPSLGLGEIRARCERRATSSRAALKAALGSLESEDGAWSDV